MSIEFSRVKHSTVAAKDAKKELDELVERLEADDMSRAQFDRDVLIVLQLMAGRLLTAVAWEVNLNYPQVRDTASGGRYQTPSRNELVKMIQEM